MKYFKIIDDGKLKTSELLDKCRVKFPVWSYYEDIELDKQFPPPEKPTTFYYKKVVEADEENKNISANDFEKSGKKGITLRDRILMELAYFEEMGEHLDIDNVTICSGSRYTDGLVPNAYWRGDRFSVDGVSPGGQHGGWRVREQFTLVPLDLEPLENGVLKDLLTRIEKLEAWQKKLTDAWNG